MQFAEVVVPERPSNKGTSSGESIKTGRGCKTSTGERDRGKDSHHRRQTASCCEYVAIEPNRQQRQL
jgi:hypothetical protein